MTYLLTALLTGLGLMATTSVAQAAPPGVHYAWQVLGINTAQCLGQARQALESQGLEPMQNDATSVAGRSETVTAMFVCLESQPATTTVMVVVASDDDEQALALREALKQAF
ncbi:hypothetical protein [Phormidium tenue]|uniref:DUF732 domain-containing protein n=2 Tax=Phormidium tenue TaxID=126344 RepID=A0A1U7J8B0_9CYAN|nr:hypothetical protein [Phormidium tenue]MBD2231256.1 hypothetical protein [Phormidium tenue FACHB-1052]OKH49501.1 hypothetical protein NIES30_06555 [Phormidium tenue NIES-30]